MSAPDEPREPMPPDEDEPVESAAPNDDDEQEAAKPAPPAPPPPRPGFFAERPEVAVEVPVRRLAAQSRRDFMLFAAGVIASGLGAWWLLPDRRKARLVGNAAHDRLDTLAGRVGLSRANREKALNGALTFDD